MRAFLDANVIASGLLGLRGVPTSPTLVLLEAYSGAYVSVVSHRLLAEVENTLRKPYFLSRVDPSDASVAVDWFRTRSEIIRVEPPVPVVATHPEDDFVIAAALAGRCDYLVTGDSMLLKIGRHGSVEIVSPRDFLEVLSTP